MLKSRSGKVSGMFIELSVQFGWGVGYMNKNSRQLGLKFNLANAKLNEGFERQTEDEDLLLL